MTNYNWCHGPNCHENHTQDRIRGVKGNKVLRTRKIAINNWNQNNHWQWFCSQGCYTDFFMNMQINADRLRQGPSLLKHLLKFKLKLGPIILADHINKKL